MIFLPTVVGVMRFGVFYQHRSFSTNADKSLVDNSKSLVEDRWQRIVASESRKSLIENHCYETIKSLVGNHCQEIVGRKSLLRDQRFPTNDFLATIFYQALLGNRWQEIVGRESLVGNRCQETTKILKKTLISTDDFLEISSNDFPVFSTNDSVSMISLCSLTTILYLTTIL